jgi:hypothetical protein
MEEKQLKVSITTTLMDLDIKYTMMIVFMKIGFRKMFLQAK